jgi:hypothetical protein
VVIFIIDIFGHKNTTSEREKKKRKEQEKGKEKREEKREEENPTPPPPKNLQEAVEDLTKEGESFFTRNMESNIPHF